MTETFSRMFQKYLLDCSRSCFCCESQLLSTFPSLLRHLLPKAFGTQGKNLPPDHLAISALASVSNLFFQCFDVPTGNGNHNILATGCPFPVFCVPHDQCEAINLFPVQICVHVSYSPVSLTALEKGSRIIRNRKTW